MGMEDLAAASMATVMPQIEEQLERTISDETWLAIEAGEIGLGFDVLLKGRTVDITCTIRRGIACGNELAFKVSRSVAPATLA